MRKSLLAMAALMGVATLPAHAWRVNIDKETYADIGFSTQIWGRNEGKRTDGPRDHNATNFSVNLANITASGQVNKLVYFNINAESGNPGFRQPFIVRDAFIGMKFADEFRIQAGAMRVPFSRIALTSSYNFLIPTQALGDVTRGLPINPIDALGVLGDGSRDAGIVVWGNVADGMLKYYLGVSDGRYDKRGVALTFKFNNTDYNVAKDNLAYTIRLQFTPTMLGFKGETGYTLADTYLGKQNVLTFGVGYRTVKAQTTGAGSISSSNFNHNYSKTAKLWTVDMLYEQKFGDIVPNLQVGYIQAKDVTYKMYRENSSPNHVYVLYGKATQIYAQAQLLYDQVVGFGKPALAIRWEQNKNKDLSTFDATDGVTDVDTTTKPKNTRFGVFVNYYIKGQAAKVSLGVDSVSRNTDSKNNDPNASSSPLVRGKSFTDFTLHLQTQF